MRFTPSEVKATTAATCLICSCFPGQRSPSFRALTDGMAGANAMVAVEDLKKLLERHGLNLIAERVEDEKTVVQLLDYAVDFAQGYLFGEPRAVRDEAAKPAEKPEAAAILPFKRSA